ncbi:MAG: HNH endonuclease [Parcubacteria group bacterium]|nr:HNH endonuclease [Parcubacteria group bacterium]
MFPYYKFLFQRANYPENWDGLRKAVYRRDRWQCQKCGIKNTQLHAHHQTPLSIGGSNDTSNLITLCKNCHIDSHPHMWLKRWKESNPQAVLALRIVTLSTVISLLIIFGFSWWKIIALIIIFQYLF